MTRRGAEQREQLDLACDRKRREFAGLQKPRYRLIGRDWLRCAPVPARLTGCKIDVRDGCIRTDRKDREPAGCIDRADSLAGLKIFRSI